MTLRLKACPRCNGDLMAGHRDDVDGTMTCLQCGRTVRALLLRQPARAVEDSLPPQLKKAS